MSDGFKMLRVEVFQLLFASNEMSGLVSDSISFGSGFIMDTSEFCKPLYFEHSFSFDLNDITLFSNRIAALILNDYQRFKKILRNITYRIFKRIVSIKSNKRIMIDIQQIKINIFIDNLPVNDSVITVDKMLMNGPFTSVRGQIVDIKEREMKAIRFLFKCKNPECQHISYKTLKEKNNKVFQCKLCKKQMEEDCSGNIATPQIEFTLNILESFCLDQIKCFLIGQDLCSSRISIGQIVQICGFLKIDENYNTFFKVVSIKKVINNIPRSLHTFSPNYNGLENFIDSIFDTSYSEDSQRIVLAILIVLINEGKLLITIKNEDEYYNIMSICKNINDSRIQYQFKSGKSYGIMSIPDAAEQTIIIPHFELLTKTEQEYLFKCFERGEINKSKVRSVVCICHHENATPELSSFDLAVRMSGVNGHIKFNSLLQYIIVNAKKKVKTIMIEPEQSDLLTKYAQLNTNDYLFKVSTAICALRNNDYISEIDVMMSIYYSEERKAALTNMNTALSSFPPKGYYFFNPEISIVPTTDQEVLYDIWVSKVKKMLQK